MPLKDLHAAKGGSKKKKKKKRKEKKILVKEGKIKLISETWNGAFELSLHKRFDEYFIIWQIYNYNTTLIGTGHYMRLYWTGNCLEISTGDWHIHREESEKFSVILEA